jgi:elongator complex protein 3
VDLCEVKRLLGLGVTRVELGVQNIYDDIYKVVDRGHTVEDVINSTRLLKDTGIKVCYHMMPGLPNSNPMMDLNGFNEIFENPDFRPDMIKIYPTLVLKGTKLYDWWKAGSFTPLTTKNAVQLVADMKMMVPPWVRIMRVQRDIPANLIEAGVDKSNLRQLVQLELAKRGNRCNCIRCREVGHRPDEPNLETLEIKRQQYEASGGLEYFLSVEDIQDVLIGFLRLRIPSSKADEFTIHPSLAYIRELHVYGQMVPVGLHQENSWQHLGWGKKLLEEAESITRNEHGISKLLVTSALGTKEYYKNLGYEKDGPYVSKKISPTTT